jgi:hypothetical protein
MFHRQQPYPQAYCSYAALFDQPHSITRLGPASSEYRFLYTAWALLLSCTIVTTHRCLEGFD